MNKVNKFMTNSFTESMWEEVIGGGYIIKPFGLVDLESIKEEEITMCVNRASIINRLKEIGFDYDGSEKVEKIFPRPGDVVYVLRAREGGNIKRLIGSDELGKFTKLECHKYVAVLEKEL